MRNAPTPAAREARGANRITLAAQAAPAPSPAPGRARYALWGALVLVAMAVAYAGTRGAAPGHAPETRVADRASRIPAVQQVGIDTEADSEDSESLEASAAAKGTGASRPPAKTQAPARLPAITRTARNPATAMSGAGAQAPAEKVATDPRQGNSTSGSAPGHDASTHLARAPVTQTAMTADDGLALAAALEKCGDEKFLAGVVCEQKVRLRYCDGKWGQVPQCTAVSKVD